MFNDAAESGGGKAGREGKQPRENISIQQCSCTVTESATRPQTDRKETLIYLQTCAGDVFILFNHIKLNCAA